MGKQHLLFLLLVLIEWYCAIAKIIIGNFFALKITVTCARYPRMLDMYMNLPIHIDQIIFVFEMFLHC